MIAQLDAKFIRARPSKVWSRLIGYFLFEGRPATTRGRWINPLVLAGHRLWRNLPVAATDPEPIFILGVGRSGTTILGKILALHREVGYLNEPKALWHAALGNDDVIGSYSKTPGRYRMSATDLGRLGAQNLARSYRSFMGLTGSARIVDKYPELIFRSAMIDQAFPRGRKIILIRNGADICRSIAHWSTVHGTETAGSHADWWGVNDRKWRILASELVPADPELAPLQRVIAAFENHADRAAVEWVLTMREAARLQREREPGLIPLRYENLVARPAFTLERLFDACGLCHDDIPITYACDVLRKRPADAPPVLHPAILPAFNSTMKSLGYEEIDA